MGAARAQKKVSLPFDFCCVDGFFKFVGLKSFVSIFRAGRARRDEEVCNDLGNAREEQRGSKFRWATLDTEHSSLRFISPCGSAFCTLILWIDCKPLVTSCRWIGGEKRCVLLLPSSCNVEILIPVILLHHHGENLAIRASRCSLGGRVAQL